MRGAVERGHFLPVDSAEPVNARSKRCVYLGAHFGGAVFLYARVDEMNVSACRGYFPGEELRALAADVA
jgi:hypothetical protein